MLYKELNQITPKETLPGTNRTRFYIGDNFMIEVSKCEHDLRKSHDLMNVWKRAGYIQKTLKTHIHVDTYFTDENGSCYGWYNPTCKLTQDCKRMVIDFDYIKEYNAENIQYLLAKCIEAYNNDLKVRTH